MSEALVPVSPVPPVKTDEEIELRVAHIAANTRMKLEHIRDLASLALRTRMREASALAAVATAEWEAVPTPSTVAVNELSALVGKPNWPNAFDLLSLQDGLKEAASAVGRLATEWDGLSAPVRAVKMVHVGTIVMLCHDAILKYEPR